MNKVKIHEIVNEITNNTPKPDYTKITIDMPSWELETKKEKNMEILENRITNDIMSAMKNKDEVSLSALRSVKTAIQNEKVNGKLHDLTNSDIIKIIQKQIKQRNEAEEIYRNNSREELANKEYNERIVLEKYVPKMLSESELEVIIDQLITIWKASSIKDMGKIMSELNKNYVGCVDGKLASSIIRKKLK